jgi:hypothetical protein
VADAPRVSCCNSLLQQSVAAVCCNCCTSHIAGQQNTRILLQREKVREGERGGGRGAGGCAAGQENTRIQMHVSHTLVTGSGVVPLRLCNRAAAELQQGCNRDTTLRTPTAASCIWCRRSGVVTLEIFFLCSGQAVALFRGRDLALDCGHGRPLRAGALSSLLTTQEHLQERVGAVA